MTILDSPAALAECVPALVAAAGFFDGVHLGHQAILAEAVARARAQGAQAWALTFEPHPLAIVAPARRPLLLTALELRLERLAESGVDGCLLMPFTPALAARTASEFVADVFGGWMMPGRRCTVVAGENWRFGRARAGDLAALRVIGGGAIGTYEAPTVTLGGERVCSSAIRQAVLNGDLPRATAMLGRPHAIRETTIAGRGVGGGIGFATANMRPSAEVLPPVGVYEVAASRLRHREAGWMKGVANLGFCPTFEDAALVAPMLEVHLLDFAGDLHDETLDVRFIRRLRDEIRFDSTAALVRQIRRDIAAVRG